MIALLYAWLNAGERTSVSTEATHLKKPMGDEQYKGTMQSVGFQHLVRALLFLEHLVLLMI